MRIARKVIVGHWEDQGVRQRVGSWMRTAVAFVYGSQLKVSRFGDNMREVACTDIYSLGAKAGELTEKAAKLTGLKPGTAVAVANVDAHVAVPAVGITEPGKMLMIIGTSTCRMVLGAEEKIVPGMCGVVEDGISMGLMHTMGRNN